MESALNTAARAGRDIAAWVPPLARFGYAAKGIVYLGIGYLALRAALAAGSPTGASGALAQLTRNGGRWLLLVVALGLFAHALWRFVQAGLDPEHRERNARRAVVRLLYFVSGAIYASLGVTALQLFQGRAAGSGHGERTLAEFLLSQPAGGWLLGLVGLGVVAFGLQQLVVAWRADFARRLWVVRPATRKGIVAIGRIGTAARAVVFLVLGGFFIAAARRHDPAAAGGTEEVLRWLGNGWLLAAVATGLMAYGVLQLANAAFRRIAAPRV